MLFQCLVGVSLLAPPGTAAHAQPAPATDSCAPPPHTSAEPASTAERVAVLYRRFECHFARQEYQACLPYLEQACQLTDSPRCLLNLGAVHHALMHCQLARGYYQKFIDRSPYDESAPAARAALDELERACPQPQKPAAPTPAPTLGMAPSAIAPLSAAPDVSPDVSPNNQDSPAAAQPALAPREPADTQPGERGQDHVLAWTLLGTGAATLTATVVLAAYGARAERDYEARARLLEPSARRSDSELHAIDQRGERSNRLALALGVVSGLLAGAGATLWLTDAWQSEDGVSLTLTPDGTALSSYSGRF